MKNQIFCAHVGCGMPIEITSSEPTGWKHSEGYGWLHFAVPSVEAEKEIPEMLRVWEREHQAV